MMPLQQALERVLKDLTSEPAILGAALVSRDGLCVKSAGQPELGRETFSAMTATLMGAAEIALAEFEGGRADHIIATTPKVTMVLIGSTHDLLLVATLASDAPPAPLLERLRKAAADVASAAGG